HASTAERTAMAIDVLVPTYGTPAPRFVPAPRLATVEGATVGIISNGKHGTVPFFDALGAALREDHGVATVERLTKPNYSAPAGDELIDRARRWQALVAGVGD
ncbi:MAG: UGSC family (seleno)protein, partial [Actinomycetota bacterium]